MAVEIEKQTAQTLRFTGAACQMTITGQVVFELDVVGGKQAINFPVTQLPAVYALLSTAAVDADVLALIEAHTPQPEPEPEPEPDLPVEPEGETIP